MDYSNLNNYLNQLDIEEKKNNVQVVNKYKEYNVPINSNLKDRNNNIMLNRELLLNNNINYSLQIANPQRLNIVKKDKTNNVNDKINQYKFNNIERSYNPKTIINDMRIPTTKYDYDKNSINNKISERGLHPSKLVNKSI